MSSRAKMISSCSPGSDQLILSFRIGGESANNLEFLLTDKLGREMRRVPFANIDVLIADYTATLENLFNFNVKLAKRAAIKVATLRNIWLEVEKNNVEQQFAIDMVRIVG